MAVSIIDGTLEAADLKRVRGTTRVYQSLTFRLRDGSSKSIAKAIAHEDVGALLEVGNSGRFYLYTAVDHRGVHGVRDDRGRSAFAYSKANETAMLVTGCIGVAMLLGFYAMNKFSIWPVLCIVIGVPFYFLYRQTRAEATRQYERDGGPPATAA
ncbi:MAG TPA: hypothetical protein VGO55_06085 [Allosphingosinicella sp.]|jgi:hypothetical protein|nr:hypothetical protein [Allosphingosinicella sp.]